MEADDGLPDILNPPLCEAHPDPDGQMQRCAEACRRSAQTCREMGQAR